MKRKALVVLIIGFILCARNASAETIELKNGREITAKIIRETEDSIVVSRHDGGFIYAISRDRIKAIRGSPPEEMEVKKTEKRLKALPVDAEEEKARKEKLKKYQLEKYEEEVLAAKKARGRIKIKFLEGRFGIVEALLNNKVRASLLVDSGASHVVISEEIARQLGIENLDEKPRIHATLADGSVSTCISVTLDSVEVGNSRAKNVKAAVSKTPPGVGLDGLLGMTFLGNFHVKMDAKDNSLILEKY